MDKYNRGTHVRVVDNGNLLYFEIEDAAPPNFPNARPPKLLAYFNKKMVPTGFGTNNQYDIMARDLYQEEKIPFLPDYEYFEAFKDSLIYWDK